MGITSVCLALLTALSISFTCTNVRKAVGACGLNTVISKARSAGATEEQIQQGIRCLKR